MISKQRLTTIVLTITGLGLFGLAFLHLDPKKVLETVGRVSALELAALFLLRLVYWLFRAVAWKTVLSGCGGKASFSHLLQARLAGHAVGFLTPSSKLGGEAFKVFMVPRVPRRCLAASAIVDKTLELQATVAMVALGIVVALARISMPPLYQRIFLGLTAVLILLIFLLLRQQRRGLFAGILHFLDRRGWRIPLVERNRRSISEADARISGFYSRTRRSTRAFVLLLYTAMILWWTLEIHLNLRFVGAVDVTPDLSFLLVTLGSFAYLLPGTPGSIGIYEATYLSLYTILGIPLRAGLALILFRRILALAWAGIGLLIIARIRRIQNRESAGNSHSRSRVPDPHAHEVDHLDHVVQNSGGKKDIDQ